MPEGTCTNPACDEPVYCRALCVTHYDRYRRTGSTELAPRKTLEERFWEKVNKNGPVPAEIPVLGSCWDWMGARDSAGYGRFNVSKRSRPAHRVAYELLIGPIPAGLVMDHLCRRPSCVRHVEPVTQAVNLARGNAPSVLQAHYQRLRDLAHCKRGHEFSPENTSINSKGKRVCKACAREHSARYRSDPIRREKTVEACRRWRAAQKQARLSQSG